VSEGLRHGAYVAARAAGATLAASALAQAVVPSLAVPAAAACAAGAVAFELSRLVATFRRRFDYLDADVAQPEAMVALQHVLRPRRPLPPMRGYAIAPDFGLALVRLIDDERPQLVVETGSGVSTLIIAYQLERIGGGIVIALELDAGAADRTRAELARHGLSRFARVVHAPLEPIAIGDAEYRWHSTRELADLDAIDLVLDDSPPGELGPWLRYASLPTLAPKLSPRGVFAMNRIGAEERATLARWRRELPEFDHELFATKKGHAILRRRA
jgi:predicted O-methyltransferase YrrM